MNAREILVKLASELDPGDGSILMSFEELVAEKLASEYNVPALLEQGYSALDIYAALEEIKAAKEQELAVLKSAHVKYAQEGNAEEAAAAEQAAAENLIEQAAIEAAQEQAVEAMQAEAEAAVAEASSAIATALAPIVADIRDRYGEDAVRAIAEFLDAYHDILEEGADIEDADSVLAAINGAEAAVLHALPEGEQIAAAAAAHDEVLATTGDPEAAAAAADQAATEVAAAQAAADAATEGELGSPVKSAAEYFWPYLY